VVSVESKNNMNTKTIVSITNPLEMAGFIKSNGTQCRFVSIVTDTPVTKMRKTSPFQGVRKVSRKLGLVNANYNTSVRNRIADKLGVKLSEVEYENGETWYVHLQTADGKSLPLVQHKEEAKRGKLYLQYYPHKSTSAYVMPNGDTVAEAELKPWLYAESKRPDYKPTVIAVELGNVKEIRASGVIMQAEDLDEAEAALA
jgi:hypothetical protein